MKENELRVGVYIEYCDEVYKVDSECIMRHMGDEQDDAYKPIPLTEEWLVKFGFTDTNESDNGIAFFFPNNANAHWTNEVMLWSVFHSKFKHPEDEYFCFMMGEKQFPNIEYVHQLQNLYFALTGEELIIK